MGALRGRSTAMVAAVASVALIACATSRRTAAPATTPTVAQPAPRPTFRCGPSDSEYDTWFGDVFGRGIEVIHDGPYPERLNAQTGDARTRAERMLRRGIAACDIFAVEAIERAGWSSLTPDLRNAVTAEKDHFRIHVILALKSLGSPEDLTAELIAGLGARSMEARMTAAIGARQFSLDRLRAPLLDRVRHDPSSLVRYHAIDSLIDLADIYPRSIREHPAVAVAMHDTNKSPLLEVFGLDPPLKPEDLRRLDAAANELDRLITDRLAAGPCSKKFPLTEVGLHYILLDDHTLALTVEESIGSCARTLAFVAFLQSPGGFGQWLATGTTGVDPLSTSVETRPSPVKVEYRRATKTLIVGSVVLDTAQANLAVLSADAHGVRLRSKTSKDLSFERRGRPQSPSPVDVLRFHSEIEAEIRTLLDRSPELRDLIPRAP